MTVVKFKLALGGGAYGPGDIFQIIVADEGTIAGPKLPNWQPEYVLVRCIDPTSYRDEELKYLVLSPRHAAVSISDIRRGGVAVAVGRILPWAWDAVPRQFGVEQVEYWAVGFLSLFQDGL